MKTSILSLALICFLALNINVKAQSRLAVGTQLTMGDDSRKSIENITVGDIVLSYNPTSKTYEKKKVLGVDKVMYNRMVRIALENKLQVLVTGDYPLLAEKGWVSVDTEAAAKKANAESAKQCNIGDYIFFYDILSTGSDRVSVIEGIPEPMMAYSLQLEGGNGSVIANGFILGIN